MNQPDYPAIRATLICPLCLQDKDAIFPPVGVMYAMGCNRSAKSAEI